MNRAFLYITALLLFIPFLHFPRAGGSFSLLSPYNLFVWEIAAGTIFIAALQIAQNQTVFYPRQLKLILAMTVLLIISGAASGESQTTEWVFRSSALTLGLFFFLAFFQFNPSRRQVDTLIYIIIASLLLHAVVAFLQMLPGKPLASLIPHPPKPRPVGVFLQPNLTASALVTAITLALFQICSPAFRHRHQILQIMCFLALFACSLVVTSSGSRVGILGGFLAVPLLVYARGRLAQPRHLIIAALCIVAGIAMSLYLSDGLLKAYSKMSRLASGSGELRIIVYVESFKLFLEQPFLGHGIGNFQKAFHQHMAEYMQANGGTPVLGKGHFGHPHNELLLWAVEGGIVAIAGLFFGAFAVIKQLISCGRQRGLALAAILIPLTLHTQVEFPFYSSSLHWLLFLILLFVVFSYGQATEAKAVSKFRSIVTGAIAGCLLATVLLVCTNLFKTGRQLSTYLVYGQVHISELEQAQDSFYFNELAALLTNSVLLHDGLVLENPDWVRRYVLWAESYVKQTPAPSLYHDMLFAYRFLGEQEKFEQAKTEGYYLFPDHPYIRSAEKAIASGERFPGMLKLEHKESSQTGTL